MTTEIIELKTGKVTIFLMTEKGYSFIKSVPENLRSTIEMVVVGNDHSIQKDYEQEIIDFCTSTSIPFVKRSDFSNITSEYVMSVSWRWLIKHHPEKLIVFHDSLLPKYRGFSPLVNALINGEKEVGVTAIFGAKEFDTGDVIAQAKTTINYPIKIQDAIAKINDCYNDVGIKVLRRISEKNSITATPQNNKDASYSVWRDELDYRIDWTKSAGYIGRMIDAVGYPYKGAYTTFDENFVRIHDAIEIEDVHVENRDPGKVLFTHEGYPTVICGQGMLKILKASIESNGNAVPLIPVKKFRIRFI